MEREENCNCLFCHSKCPHCQSLNVSVLLKTEYSFNNDTHDLITVRRQNAQAVVNCEDCGETTPYNRVLKNAMLAGMFFFENYEFKPHDREGVPVVKADNGLLEAEELNDMSEKELVESLQSTEMIIEEYNNQIFNIADKLNCVDTEKRLVSTLPAGITLDDGSNEIYETIRKMNTEKLIQIVEHHKKTRLACE